MVKGQSQLPRQEPDVLTPGFLIGMTDGDMGRHRGGEGRRETGGRVPSP